MVILCLQNVDDQTTYAHLVKRYEVYMLLGLLFRTTKGAALTKLYMYARLG